MYEKFSQLNLISKVATFVGVPSSGWIWWSELVQFCLLKLNWFEKTRQSASHSSSLVVSLASASALERHTFVEKLIIITNERQSLNFRIHFKRNKLVSSRFISSQHYRDGSIIHTNPNSRGKASERTNKQTNGRTNKQISSRILSRSRSWSLLLLSSVCNVCLFV